MTCKECIHSGLCYKENNFNDFPDRCGDFISDKVLEERPQGEWVGTNEYIQHLEETTGEKYKIGFNMLFCNNCWETPFGSNKRTNFCPNCGADMRGNKE